MPLPSAVQQTATGDDPPIAVHSYRGRTQQEATVAFKAQAARLATRGYVPVSQSWASGGRTSAASFWIALAVVCLFAGFLFPPLWALTIIGLILGLVSSKGSGSLTVTYHRR